MVNTECVQGLLRGRLTKSRPSNSTVAFGPFRLRAATNSISAQVLRTSLISGGLHKSKNQGHEAFLMQTLAVCVETDQCLCDDALSGLHCHNSAVVCCRGHLKIWLHKEIISLKRQLLLRLMELTTQGDFCLMRWKSTVNKKKSIACH